MIYKFEFKKNSKWVPRPIYIGRTTQGNTRFSQHKTKMRHVVDLLSEENKYSIDDRICNACTNFKYGIFRLRAGADFKMGIFLFMQGVNLNDIDRNKMMNYIEISSIDVDNKRDQNGVSVNEYKNIDIIDSQRVGFNGVSSYEFEADEDLNDSEIANITSVLNSDDLYQNSVWFNNYGLSTYLEYEMYHIHNPIGFAKNFKKHINSFGSVLRKYDELVKKLKNYNKEFFGEIETSTSNEWWKKVEDNYKYQRINISVFEKNYFKNEIEINEQIDKYEKIVSHFSNDNSDGSLVAEVEKINKRINNIFKNTK